MHYSYLGVDAGESISLRSGRGGATTQACSPLAPPLLYSSSGKGTFELQGHLALSPPPTWTAAVPQLPPLHGFCRSLWLSGACCRGCSTGWGHTGGERKEAAVTLQCLTWVQPAGGPDSLPPVTDALGPSGVSCCSSVGCGCDLGEVTCCNVAVTPDGWWRNPVFNSRGSVVCVLGLTQPLDCQNPSL